LIRWDTTVKSEGDFHARINRLVVGRVAAADCRPDFPVLGQSEKQRINTALTGGIFFKIIVDDVHKIGYDNDRGVNKKHERGDWKW